MKRTLFAAVAAMAFAGVAQAQRPVQVGVAGGASLPTGDLNTGTKTGFNVALSASLKPATLPFGVRLEGAWDQFAYDPSTSDNFRVLSATANGVVDIPSSVGPKVYLIAGAGLYNLDPGGSASSENKFGFNLGGGVRFPLSGLETFVEARFHDITGVSGGNVRYVPVTFGVRF